MAQDSNFYRVYKLAYRDRSESLKSLILIAIIVSLLSLASLFFVGIIRIFSWNYLITAIVFLVISFALLPIFFLVAPKSQLYLSIGLFSIIPFIPILLQAAANNYLFIVIAGLFVAFLLSSWRMKSEANSLIDLNFPRIISKGIIFLSIATLLIIGTLAYFNKTDIDFSKFNFSTINVAGISSATTIDGIIKSYLEKQTRNLGSLSNSASNLLLKQTKDNLSQMFGIPISGNETISTLIINYFKAHWLSFSFGVKILMAALILSLIFSLISLFNTAFSIIINITSWFIFKLLILIKYLKIKKIGVEKEEIAFQ